ncbi:activity-dependent neuroprotector homeobox protein 2 [Rhinophrynus dorsalis]
MFQPPHNSLEKIRKARKRVKQILLQIGLESCRDLLEGINSYNPGDKYFSSTSWEDVSLWEAIGRRNGYRSKPFCCSLCKFSTKLAPSFKSHLQRYHEDEKDLEIMAACPSCTFTSQSKTVVKHMRIFHTNTRKAQSATVKETVNFPRNHLTVKFSCLKCSFTDSLYYSMKKHVLMTHYDTLVGSYFGERTEEEIHNINLNLNMPFFKIQTFDKFYCRKCNSTAATQDALIYHILTSDKHRDLEQKLRTDISEISRDKVRKYIPKHALVASASKKSLAAVSTSQDMVTPLLQNGPSHNLGTSAALTKNIVATLASGSNSSENLIQTTSSTSQVGFVTGSLQHNQNITLQSSLPQSVFVSPRFPLNQSVTATVLSSGCNVSGHILPTGQTTVRPAVLPLNQSLAGGLLPVNQQAVLACSSQSLQPNVINVNQAGRPAVLSVNPALGSENITASQPGVHQNTFLTAPIFRQLIPTGKQVNGIPTYTLAPISVTLPVAPCTVPSIKPPKVPAQVSQPDKVVPASNSPAVAPSPPVVQQTQTSSQKTPKPTTAPNLLGKEARQWKTCPVCNELFPSNVYEVHMQVAHVKAESNLNKDAEKNIGNEVKEPVIIAAQVSFLKVLKEKSIRCITCRTFTTEEDILKHLLKHGMVCMYCKAVFHELRNFVYHMKIMHLDRKRLHVDFARKGFEMVNDANGNVLFPRFDFNLKVSKDELGDKEINLAVVAGSNPQTASSIYIKIQHENTESSDNQSKCPFCNCALSKTEMFETHLKERHHIMPTVHTILKTPAFKCIHCCGVYTGSMTLSAIAVHLLRCRNAPKDSSSGVDIPPENNVGKGPLQVSRGMHDYAKAKPPPCSTSDLQVEQEESKSSPQKNAPNDAEKESPVPSKRRKVEVKSDPSEQPIIEDFSHSLALVPAESDKTSHESKKEFLIRYFNKRPYPSKQEIEILSTLLEMWKSDVASYFGTRRYMCLKFFKNHKHRVLLGFKMAELKKVQHSVELNEDY